MIPVIDLFAGPGGLGEGFASFCVARSERAFRIALSIEKDPVAHSTLRLRAFFRQFRGRVTPEAYYEALRTTESADRGHWGALKGLSPREARIAECEARNAELGKHDPDEIDQWIRTALRRTDEWVLIGGPPCQAYSIAGRSRNIGKAGYKSERDERHFLYREYLRILAVHLPPLFVMENVKGLLSASVQSESIFDRILNDLREPRASFLRVAGTVSARYRILSLTVPSGSDYFRPADFVVEMERYGIPQARHRVILLGIREDVLARVPCTLIPQNKITVAEVMAGLPRLRSGISGLSDNLECWRAAVTRAPWKRWLGEVVDGDARTIAAFAEAALDKIRRSPVRRGAEFIPYEPTSRWNPTWYLDKRLGGICNSSTRSHMVRDLQRYFYASIFAKMQNRSPNLSDFPADLLPNHRNVAVALRGGHFSDRFRVQLANRPATTITSHIAKDGHYYIHFDPAQCRSLTVREAARLQTFPDNYFFCGSRTEQYAQVGNAVPPLLAMEIARIVWSVLRNGSG